ncbi:MAG: class I SAM-dependent methyltransferase [Atopococcus tabaci]|uniref:Class I SAM-dependent methyltransferase n=1 Tax=Atopococcus tabaci TaxID=269774 RepID=A0AA43RJT2_9LACT|nr:class I SAM-dependent methyltransferase [Atopococcus tabaci]
MIKLSKRLKEIADFIPPASRLADIGSDHAYLPIYLIQQEKIDFAVAGEVAAGPLQHAQEEVTDRNLEDRIHVRLGNGLDVLEKDDAVDHVVIAGMGGLLIALILEQGLLNHKVSDGQSFVLQPNNEEVHLRRFLLENHFEITQESILSENKHFYEIIVAKYQAGQEAEAWSEEDLLFGRFVEAADPQIFKEKWQNEKRKTKNIIASLQYSKANNDKTLTDFQHKINLIEERLHDEDTS